MLRNLDTRTLVGGARKQTVAQRKAAAADTKKLYCPVSEPSAPELVTQLEYHQRQAEYHSKKARELALGIDALTKRGKF